MAGFLGVIVLIMTRWVAVGLTRAPLRAPVGVQGVAGGPRTLDPFSAPAGIKAIVFLFTSTDCPISNRYAPEVRSLAARFGADRVVFRLMYPNPADTPLAIREHMTAFAYVGAVQAFRDPDQVLVKHAGVTVTPE